jgi:transposase
MDRQTLRDWVHRYNEGGIDALVSRIAPGRSPSLTAEQMTELRQLVLDGPDPAVHRVIRWRCVDLCEEVARRFSVTVNVGTVGKWLNAMGLTRLQPRPFHPKKDEAAQATFKKTSPAV